MLLETNKIYRLASNEYQMQIDCPDGGVKMEISQEGLPFVELANITENKADRLILRGCLLKITLDGEAKISLLPTETIKFVSDVVIE